MHYGKRANGPPGNTPGLGKTDSSHTHARIITHSLTHTRGECAVKRLITYEQTRCERRLNIDLRMHIYDEF